VELYLYSPTCLHGVGRANSTSFSLYFTLYLVPRLKMSGTVPLLPLHVFMVWTGPTLPLLAFVYGTPTMLYKFQLSDYFTSCKGKSWTSARAIRRPRFMHPWSQIWPSIYKISVRCSSVRGKEMQRYNFRFGECTYVICTFRMNVWTL